MKQLNPVIKGILTLLAHLVIGLAILLLVQKVKPPEWIAPTVVVFVIFLVLNLTETYLFRLGNELKEYWSLLKLPYLPVGIIAGVILVMIPEITASIADNAGLPQLSFRQGFSFVSLALTFLIVAWEELWFRGIFLNYCKNHIPEVPLSLLMGLLFMVIHLLNPEFNLIRSGPALFFAGAALTILYFYYRNIWLPLGLHFGNNYFGSIIESPARENLFLGPDGYLSALILAGLFIFYLIKIKAGKTRETN